MAAASEVPGEEDLSLFRRRSLEVLLEALRPAFRGEVSIEERGKLLLDLVDTENTEVGCLPPLPSLEMGSVACLAPEDFFQREDIEKIHEPREAYPHLPLFHLLEVTAGDFSWDRWES